MTFYDFVKLLALFSPVMLLIGVMIGVYKFKYLDIYHRGITIYFVMLLVIDIASRFLHTGNNLFILLIYSLLELIIFIYFYYKYVYKRHHILLLVMSFLSITYLIYEIVIFEFETKKFQTYSKVVDNFTIVMLILTFFHERINLFKDSKWDNFRLNVVLLVFFSINLVFFLPYNFLINESTDLKFYFWLGIVISTVAFYSYLTHSIWKNGRTRRLLPSGSR